MQPAFCLENWGVAPKTYGREEDPLVYLRFPTQA